MMRRGKKKFIIKNSSNSNLSQFSRQDSEIDISRSIMEGSIIYKGYDDNNSQASSVISVNSGGSSSPTFTIHREQVKGLLKTIKTKCHTKISDLDDEHKAIYDRLVEIITLTYNTQSIYDHLIKDIREVFPSNEKISPLTVGAYFTGCFTSDNFSGKNECNPKCAGNTINNMKQCEDSVIFFEGDKLTYLVEKKTIHAYVYVGDRNFKGFTQQNINSLKMDHIYKVSLIFSKPNDPTMYEDVGNVTSVDKLPLRDTVTPTNKNEQSSLNWVSIIMLIFIILIIIGLLYAFYNYN